MPKRNFWKKLKKGFTVLAPMDDVTDFAFREFIATVLPESARPDVYFTEFASTDALTTKGYESQIRRLKYSNNQRPIVAQIWGTNPEKYFEIAKLVENLGFDGVDINMGCPDKTITKHGACSALIENPSLALEIINAAKEGARNIPVSVKTRIGYRIKKTEEWISFLLKSNINALTIHARTAKEMSLVPANWDEIKKSVELRNIINKNTIIIGNGDVKHQNEALEKVSMYGCDGVMIGRGMFANIFCFDSNSTKKEVDKNEMMALFIKHLEIFYKTWGPGNLENNHVKNIEIMKKFAKVYINNFYGAGEIRSKLMMSKNYEELLANAKNLELI